MRCNKQRGEGVTASFCPNQKPCPRHPEPTTPSTCEVVYMVRLPSANYAKPMSKCGKPLPCPDHPSEQIKEPVRTEGMTACECDCHDGGAFGGHPDVECPTCTAPLSALTLKINRVLGRCWHEAAGRMKYQGSTELPTRGIDFLRTQTAEVAQIIDAEIAALRQELADTRELAKYMKDERDSARAVRDHHIRVTDRLERQLSEANARAEKDHADKDAAYEERNRVVAVLARMAIAAGFVAVRTRTAIEGWSDDWHGCIRIELPCGQVSWHYHDSQAFLFADLPEGSMDYDGHTTEQKYQRLHEWRPLESQQEKMKAAARKFMDAVVRIDASDDMRAVYNMARIHGVLYTGQTWADERDELRALLSNEGTGS